MYSESLVATRCRLRALEPDRFYRMRLEFDAQRAQLYLDRKVDGNADTAPSAACPAKMQIGTASGKDYHLEDAIAEIVMRAPASR